MIRILVLFLTFNSVLSKDIQDLISKIMWPGHLQPLGSQSELIDVDVLTELPSSLEFFEKFVKPSRPVLLRNAAKSFPSFNNWRNDTYLKEKYGRWKVYAELGKKEDRSHRDQESSFKSFIDDYNHSDIYLVSDIMKPNPLTEEVFVPRPLSCSSFTSSILSCVLWFSSGGTKSVLHTDGSENLNCLFDGTKELFLAHKKHTNLIELEEIGSYSKVDVEKVDLRSYPKLFSVPWYYAKMEPGDCFYIPFHWFHHVKSSDSRNLAVNLWWDYFVDLPNKERCKEEDSEMKKFSDVQLISSDERLRNNLASVFHGELEPLTRDRFFDCLFSQMQSIEEPKKITRKMTDELFTKIDENGDDLVEFKNLYDADIEFFQPFIKMMDVDTVLNPSDYEELEDDITEKQIKEEL